MLRKTPSDLAAAKVVTSAGMLRRLMNHWLWAVTVLIMSAVAGTIIWRLLAGPEVVVYAARQGDLAKMA